MSEMSIVKFLYNIKLNNIFCLVKVPNTKKDVIEKYCFQACDENKNLVTGDIIVSSNNTSIIYKYENDNNIHKFSNDVFLFNANDYEVSMTYSLVNNEQETIITSKKGINIPKSQFFNFDYIKETEKQKILVKY